MNNESYIIKVIEDGFYQALIAYASDFNPGHETLSKTIKLLLAASLQNYNYHKFIVFELWVINHNWIKIVNGWNEMWV